MSPFIKVGGLIMGFGAVVSGIFGMNLKNHVEVKSLWPGITENKISEVSRYQYWFQEAPWAFLIVCTSIVVAMIIFFLGFTKKWDFFFIEVVTCWACRYYPILLPVLRRYYPVLLVFLRRYYQLKADTSSAQSFTLLKNFFTYVDDLEYHVFNKRIEKVFSTILTLIYSISQSISKFDAQGEFKQAVEKITGLKITDRESEYLFKVWPWNINFPLNVF